MSLLAQRIAGLVVAIALGDFFFVQARSGWAAYWLRTDSRQTMAQITGNYWGGHGQVVYYYYVNGGFYNGRSSKNWKDLHYNNVQPGGRAPVFYSASHPWISLLYVPDAVVVGLPVLIIAFLIELVALITIIKPGSSLAFNFNGKMAGSR